MRATESMGIRLAGIVCVLATGVLHVSQAAVTTCSTMPTSGLVTKTVSGRRYELFVPSGLAAGANVPLLLSFHGAGSNGTQHAAQTKWTQFASAHGFIVAFPNGSFGTWNYSKGSSDVLFARRVVADIRSAYCIDPAHIHASGHSNGAFFAQRLACDAADLFASVSEYAGGDPGFWGGCAPSRPVAVGLFHGNRDFVVPMALGTRARHAWVGRDACSPTPTNEPVPDGAAERFSPCAAGVEVTWRMYSGQGHLWPPEPQSSDLKARSWALFMNNPKP